MKDLIRVELKKRNCINARKMRDEYHTSYEQRAKRYLLPNTKECIDNIVELHNMVNSKRFLARTYGNNIIRRNYRLLQEDETKLTNLTYQLEYLNCAVQETLEFEKKPSIIKYLLSYIG